MLEQGCGRIEMLLGASALAGRSVAFSEPEVTLSRQGAQIERLGLSEGFVKIGFALVEGGGVTQSKLGKEPERVGFIDDRSRRGRFADVSDAGPDDGKPPL
ncbi:hypothetical protein JQ597_22590 [Bradyrhizobium sp. AUGA SZCCT0177]|uniref:hypothetical protein n=1 Tax=unclassified Bradyrhizobium TaxID=2631580 RepID=UPI001BAADD0A|nr:MULTISPECIES: hypothetical protein [unclassified Bradyrhizobium]MBR1233170.1 hypothetical protein [Bradyrhizobium sp. AUGA SZCCT0182]MBR1284840.1 hypothetical protein [Bradyrhizobium sp. AUGA SZCCT0177]